MAVEAAAPAGEASQAIGRHPCPACGANLEWSASRQALVCPYCGTTARWTPPAPGDGGGIVERDLQAALQDLGSLRGWGGGRHEVRCQNCHAISVFDSARVAQRCDFCGSPAIVAHAALGEVITPQGILPFRVSEAQLRERVRRWYASRWFAPSKLRRAALTDTLRGVYLPYWTFDAHASARWRADAGYYYFTSETYHSSTGELQTRQVRRVRWMPASGQLTHFFDDELVPGTVGVRGALLRRIEPFPTRAELVPYSPEYVRGWTVERYQIDLRQAATLGERQMRDRLYSLCAQRVPGDTHRNLVVDVQYQGRTFKHVLVPVWLVSYTYGRRRYQLVANGHTGQLAGEHPYSWVKIAAAALLLALVVAVLVGVLGQ